MALEEVAVELAVGDEPLTMVVMTLNGQLGGSIILMFDELNGRQLAASLLGREAGTESEWSELEKSALMETGNILGCAYVNALTRLVGMDLFPSPPYFIQDFGASVLQQALMAQAASRRQTCCSATSASIAKGKNSIGASSSFPRPDCKSRSNGRCMRPPSHERLQDYST